MSSAEYLVSQLGSHKRSVAAGLVAFFALIAFGFWFFVSRSFDPSDVISSLAVMPFLNASGNADVEYLSDGMGIVNSTFRLLARYAGCRASWVRLVRINPIEGAKAAHIWVIHRDLKPENVLISSPGAPRIWHVEQETFWRLAQSPYTSRSSIIPNRHINGASPKA